MTAPKDTPEETGGKGKAKKFESDGDFQSSEAYKAEFFDWLDATWKEKDALLRDKLSS